MLRPAESGTVIHCGEIGGHGKCREEPNTAGLPAHGVSGSGFFLTRNGERE